MTVMPADSVGIPTITEVFNQAFSDYYVEVSFSPGSLQDYLHRNLLEPRRSLLAEDSGRLVGVLLCGDDGEITWNAGMGVHPRWRRRGHGAALLDRWTSEARARGCHRAVLEVIAHNLPARYLYRSRGFLEGRAFQGFEGRPGWQAGPRLARGAVVEATPEQLLPVYRGCHSFQKRPEVMRRLRGFRCLRTDGPVGKDGPGYLIYDDYGGLLYIFDMTPNAAGRCLLEHAVREGGPRLIRMVNACEPAEEELYRSMGFRAWMRNVEMTLDLTAPPPALAPAAGPGRPGLRGARRPPPPS